MKILNDITDFIFVENDIANIKEVDVIFILGTSRYQLPELAARLYKQGLSKYILPSGKYSSKLNKFAIKNVKDTKYDIEYETEWKFCQDVLIKKAIIVCQSFHARRVLMTYSVVFPEVDFYVCPIDTQDITKDNWFKHEYGIKRVMGEVERCGKYFNEYIKELLLN